ncbi:hypothetical protein NLI96_g6956 [Meripilus lineatus]|uniref:Uncharacterized protein n=1 Tax=Meripilus lineatus TaxID=2056292 RepID=A0AAD5V0F3_9APHY|nr:hypothetical protein NLI96_g6956 [Physisporinus lineatus]
MERNQILNTDWTHTVAQISREIRDVWVNRRFAWEPACTYVPDNRAPHFCVWKEGDLAIGNYRLILKGPAEICAVLDDGKCPFVGTVASNSILRPMRTRNSHGESPQTPDPLPLQPRYPGGVVRWKTVR